MSECRRCIRDTNYFDPYINTDMGANGISKYLENHGIHKILRQNGKNTLFDFHLIRLILKNPVNCGKIAYGRRKTEKVHGTRNDYRLVEQDNYLLVNGLHEPIVSENVWQSAQVKLLSQFMVMKGNPVRSVEQHFVAECLADRAAYPVPIIRNRPSKKISALTVIAGIAQSFRH